MAVDVDMVNMFGSIEWDSMRAAVCPNSYPEMAQWTRWQQEQPSVTVLPSGEEFATDRGAEQGDALGTVQSCLTLAAERTPAISAQTQQQLPTADGLSHVPCCEEWYIDDGQAFVKPQHLDPWLRALDASIARLGSTRGRVDDDTAKSSCRLLYPPDQRHLYE